MARQYVITEAEYQSLLDKLELANMRAANISDPYRHLDDTLAKPD